MATDITWHPAWATEFTSQSANNSHMRKIKWAFALIGLLVTFVSCDKGEEMEKGHTIVGDTLGLLILDKDGNNVMDPNIHKINPNVFYDTDMMVVFQGDTLTTE